jgi:glycosyltransferase involved in cell wall biosynthesis
MRVGIDIQHLRMDQRGIYYYIWNILEQMGQQDHLHQITLYLYGQHWMDDPARLRRWAEAFPKIAHEYFWDAPPLRLLAHRFGGTPIQAPRLAQLIDRNLVWPLWQRMATVPSGPRLWYQGPAPIDVDVFHHTVGLLFPAEGHANVITIYDLIPFHSPDYDETANILFADGFRYIDRMDLIITISEFTKQDVVSSLGVDEDVVRAIPLGVHHDFNYMENRDTVRTILAKYAIDRKPYIAHVGIIEARKNIVRLLHAFKQLKQAGNAPEHELVLAGGEGGSFEEVKAKIDELELGATVRCLGFVPRADLPAILNGADLFMLPSLYEGFGLPAIEAMACGAPVAAANTTSLPEVVGDAGCLFDPHDVDEMTAIMLRILTNRGLREAMRIAGLARAAEFSWKRTARETLDAYAEAWDRYRRFRRDGPDTGTKALQTRYRQAMRQFTLAQAANYLSEGSRISTWL